MALVFATAIKSPNGFTLIELLIVFTIMGILAVVIGGAYVSSLKKGRDGRAISDIGQIQTALELYFSANARYPNPLSQLVAGGIKTYLQRGSLPINPSTHVVYSNYWSDNINFCLCTSQLEKGAGGNARVTAGAFTCSRITYQPNGDYFCVENAQ